MSTGIEVKENVLIVFCLMFFFFKRTYKGQYNSEKRNANFGKEKGRRLDKVRRGMVEIWGDLSVAQIWLHKSIGKICGQQDSKFTLFIIYGIQYVEGGEGSDVCKVYQPLLPNLLLQNLETLHQTNAT